MYLWSGFVLYILPFGFVRMRTLLVYTCLVVYLLSDSVLYILPFGLVRMRTLHGFYEFCSVLVDGFRFVYLAFWFS